MNYLQAQTRIKELVTQFKAKGDGNAMTTAELKAWNAEVDECQQTIDAATKAFGFSGGHALSDDGAPAPGTGGSPFGPASNRDNGARLSFGTKTAAALATKMLGNPDGLHTKALAPSGSAAVGQEFRPDPIALGKPAHSLLDVLPVSPHDSAEFSYLRQTVRTNNAAVVPDYGAQAHVGLLGGAHRRATVGHRASVRAGAPSLVHRQ